jgi:NAD(P)-dependent dehydrogenase (short-subunit alcohol dehydrogenase family)
VWTPLIPATLPQEKVESFGAQVPMGRAADPDEIAPSYIFFAAPATTPARPATRSPHLLPGHDE